MSHPVLPPEMLDSIVDLLCHEPKTLRQCCLVSKSWVPRTRKYLFAVIKFPTPSHIEAWKRTFPVPSDSPAHYTHALTIRFLGVTTAPDGVEDVSIPAFPRLVRLEVIESPNLSRGYMNPAAFQGFPHTLKSLSVSSFSLVLSRVFSLICSIPFLEDLSLTGHLADFNNNDPDGRHIVAHPPTSPPLTGAFVFRVYREIGGTARRLLNLPNGLHFRKLQLEWYGRGDLHHIMELVTACSGTLECLDIACPSEGAIQFLSCRSLTLTFQFTDGGQSAPVQVNLSKATKLQHITFRCRSLGTGWITTTLETITAGHRDLQRISVNVDYVHVLVKSNPGMGWPDLERFLIKLWESRSVRTTLECIDPWSITGRMVGLAMCLLPELTRRGAIDLVEIPVV